MKNFFKLNINLTSLELKLIIIGFLGLTPFIFGLIDLIINKSNYFFLINIPKVYGIIIFTFLGGIYWGMILNPTNSISELNRCLQKSNLFKGAFVSSHINEKNLDDPEFFEFYAQLEARGIPLVLHPTVPVWGDVIKDYSLIPMMGFMVDTSIALMRLILSGTLDKYPELKIVQPHLGGILPYIMGRIQEQIEVKKRGNANIKKEIKSYFKNIYFDLVSPSDEAIEFAKAFVGSKNLMFATDHPWIEMDSMVNYAHKMKVSPEEKDDIMGSNACKLFSLKS